MDDKGAPDKKQAGRGSPDKVAAGCLPASRLLCCCAGESHLHVCVCAWGIGGVRGLWGQLPHRQRVSDQLLEGSNLSVCLYRYAFSTNTALHTNSPTLIYPFSADPAFACFVPSFGVLEIVFMAIPAWLWRDLQLLRLLSVSLHQQHGEPPAHRHEQLAKWSFSPGGP